MRRSIVHCTLLTAVAAHPWQTPPLQSQSTESQRSTAQPPDERPGGERGRSRDGEPPAGPGGFPGVPPFGLMTALDKHKDGKLSTDEIDAAIAALQMLDRNDDGKWSKEEIGWPPAFGGLPGMGGRAAVERAAVVPELVVQKVAASELAVQRGVRKLMKTR